MTWSERQALAKKRAEEEEVASRAAAAPAFSRGSPSATSAGRWGAAAVGGSAAGVGVSWEPEPEAALDEGPVVREFLSRL